MGNIKSVLMDLKINSISDIYNNNFITMYMKEQDFEKTGKRSFNASSDALPGFIKYYLNI